VARLVLLDSGPLGLVSGRTGRPKVDQCDAWLTALGSAGARVIVPEIADYEIRRELIRIGATASLKRLDRLRRLLDYAAITTAAMERAAELWAHLRNVGVPTAGREALDADAILAGQASVAGGLGDVVTIATTNLRHLARFPGVDAQLWTVIT
jgi:predicted nucleic acid-binding protein